MSFSTAARDKGNASSHTGGAAVFIHTKIGHLVQTIAHHDPGLLEEALKLTKRRLLRVFSAYAPHTGHPEKVGEDFWDLAPVALIDGTNDGILFLTDAPCRISPSAHDAAEGDSKLRRTGSHLLEQTVTGYSGRKLCPLMGDHPLPGTNYLGPRLV